MIIKHKHCWNCGHRMIWNEEEKRWECKICGYAEETKLRKGCPNYVG